MSRKQEIMEEIGRLRGELNDIEAVDDKIKDDALVGKYFKYRNSYSLPRVESDYWWLYTRVVKRNTEGGLDCRQFQTDKDGKITIEQNEWRMWQHFENDSYIEITKAEYDEAAEIVRRTVEGALV